MKDDPTIQAVREARHQISAAVGHDPRRLVEYYQQRQRERSATTPAEPTKSKQEHAA